MHEVTPDGEVVWGVRRDTTRRDEVALFAQFMVTSDLYSGAP